MLNMTLRHFRSLVVAIAVLAFALPAASTAARVDPTTDRGVVQSVGSDQIVLRALDGSVVSFAVSSATRVKLNGVQVVARRHPAGLRRLGGPPGPRAGHRHPRLRHAGDGHRPRRRDGARQDGDHVAHRRRRHDLRAARCRHRGSGSAAARQASLRPAGSARRRHSTLRTGRPGRQRAQARGGVSAATGRGGTILLVEDEEDIATLVRTYLEKDGFRVIWAARGVEGLLALEQNDIRLAILDLQLPDADGLDLCRAIRDRSSLPIVIVTATGRGDRPDHRARARRRRLRDEAVLASRARCARAGGACGGPSRTPTDEIVAAGDVVARARRAHRLGRRQPGRADGHGVRPARLPARPPRHRHVPRTAARARVGARVPGRHTHGRRPRRPAAEEARPARPDPDRPRLRVQGRRRAEPAARAGPRSLRARLFVGIAATLAVVDRRDARGRGGPDPALARRATHAARSTVRST